MKVAYRITGLSEAQIREQDFGSAASCETMLLSRADHPRQNARFAARMVVGRQDLSSKRRELAKNVPACLKFDFR